MYRVNKERLDTYIKEILIKAIFPNNYDEGVEEYIGIHTHPAKLKAPILRFWVQNISSYIIHNIDDFIEERED